MNLKLSAHQSIDIHANKEEVWRALTDPEKIKVYLYGTETITDWKVGSPIVFQGNYQGQAYKDKGNVIENRTYELLKYNYWSGFSGLEDKPENYFVVTYQLENLSEKQVRFTWHQSGFKDEKALEHTQNGLLSMLKQIKDLVENKS
jgi:uncharacterized protein YndB with AHSA1/START domain